MRVNQFVSLCFAVLAMLALACNKSVKKSSATEPLLSPDPAVNKPKNSGDDPYDKYRQKSVHNAYERKESLAEQLGPLGLRSLELDIHSKRKGEVPKVGDWFVYHDDDDSASSVKTLSEGLSLIKKEADGKRDVITLWIDLKEDFKPGEGYGPNDLDKLLFDQFQTALYTPSQFLADCGKASIFENATVTCPWPSLKLLKGRVIVVLTGAAVKDYARDAGEAKLRSAFIAPEISKEGDLQIFSHAIFFNLAPDTAMKSQLPEILRARHCVSRTWDINSEGDWKKVIGKPVHHVATNKVNTTVDPWAVILGENDSRFQAIGD